MWLHKQSPATLRVVAASKVHEAKLGELPSAETVLQLAAAEPGANARAALIIVREELLADDGETIVPIFKANAAAPRVTVADLDTLWALAGLGRTPRCKLAQPGGKMMPRKHLGFAAELWERWATEPGGLDNLREPLRSVLSGVPRSAE